MIPLGKIVGNHIFEFMPRYGHLAKEDTLPRESFIIRNTLKFYSGTVTMPTKLEKHHWHQNER